jgi:hypothetical protein
VRLPSIQLSSALVVLAVVVALTTFAESHAGQVALTRLGVVGPSDRYTELAFVAAQHLPPHLPRTPTAIHLPFTITNHEHQSESYSWKIVATGTATQQLASGEVLVREGQQAYLDPRITLTCSSSRTRVNIRLSSGEYIDFLAQCAGGSQSAHAKRSARAVSARSRPKTGSHP